MAPFDVRSGRVADANASSLGRVSVVVVNLTRFENRTGLVTDEDASSLALRLAAIAARDAKPLERRMSLPADLYYSRATTRIERHLALMLRLERHVPMYLQLAPMVGTSEVGAILGEVVLTAPDRDRVTFCLVFETGPQVTHITHLVARCHQETPPRRRRLR